MPQFPRMSIDLQEEEWSILERLPVILREENCLDISSTATKVVEWREPEELKVIFVFE